MLRSVSANDYLLLVGGVVFGRGGEKFVQGGLVVARRVVEDLGAVDG